MLVFASAQEIKKEEKKGKFSKENSIKSMTYLNNRHLSNKLLKAAFGNFAYLQRIKCAEKYFYT